MFSGGVLCFGQQTNCRQISVTLLQSLDSDLVSLLWCLTTLRPITLTTHLWGHVRGGITVTREHQNHERLSFFSLSQQRKAKIINITDQRNIKYTNYISIRSWGDHIHRRDYFDNNNHDKLYFPHHNKRRLNASIRQSWKVQTENHRLMKYHLH